MNDKRLHPVPAAGTPITEADLHGYADGQLSAARHAEVAAFLAAHPQDQTQVDDWQAQRRALHALLDPVLDEPLPLRLPLRAPARTWPSPMPSLRPTWAGPWKSAATTKRRW